MFLLSCPRGKSASGDCNGSATAGCSADFYDARFSQCSTHDEHPPLNPDAGNFRYPCPVYTLRLKKYVLNFSHSSEKRLWLSVAT
jgi:hypothetical protein